GVGYGNDYAVAYAYDEFGRFAAVTSVTAGTFTYAYLPGSDLLAGLSNGDFAVTYTYEAHRNLKTAVQNNRGNDLISKYAYAYDPIGRRTERIDHNTLFMQSVTNLFDYNPRSELISAQMNTNDYLYLYDPIGNRKKASLNAATNFYTANELNQYTNIANGVTNQPTYDPDGNMLTYGDWTFTWNGENRLIVASNTTTIIENSYDYMGRRFRKVVNGVTNTYLYDGWAMIREASPTVTNSYVYGLDLSGSAQDAGTIGGILSALLNGTKVFYCYDANGNVTDLVDTNGSSVAHYEYGPFGQKTTEPGTLSAGNPFQFSSKYLDAETELYYYGYRFYAPSLGRWISRDPIAELAFYSVFANEQQYIDQAPTLIGAAYHESFLTTLKDVSTELYQFIQNSPIDKFDYLGLSCGVPTSSYDCQCAAGSSRGTRHKANYVKQVDGCTSPIGNNPTLMCSFEGCCNNHDCQYGLCNFGKSNADQNFKTCMLGACDACNLNPVETLYCKMWAHIYYLAVKWAGGSAYDNNQSLACESCCCSSTP
ncbi:MAG: hypothetical protein EOM12_15025, partial [Verrucomicrobiae bacterium]|nr:hypothetical protein [Verrucomicrobiae bacterium]